MQGENVRERKNIARRQTQKQNGNLSERRVTEKNSANRSIIKHDWLWSKRCLSQLALPEITVNLAVGQGRGC